jgi:outer membrane protein assembly factor BamB
MQSRSLVAALMAYWFPALLLAGPPTTATFHAPPKPLAPGAVTSDWPCLLGPTHNEVCTETHLLHEFPAGGPKLVWEAEKGEGYASPVVAANRLILFHRVGDRERIDCLDALSGKPNWSFDYPTQYTDDWGYTNGPRSSPAIGDGAVFAIGAEGKLHCLDLATGKLRWQHDLTAEYKLKKGFFGVGASPLVEGDLLIVNVGAQGGPCVVAFDVHSGKVVWNAGAQWGPSYATPVPATIHGKRRVLVFAGGKSNPPTGGLLCIDPSNGKLDFEFPWRGNRRESVNASSPVVIGNDVFISECYGAGGMLLEITKDFQPKTVWANPNFGTHFMSAVEKDGYLYGVDGHGPDDAFLVCVELKSGKEVWRTQPEWNESIDTPDGPRQLPTGTYRCWLMPADGQWLVLGEYGHLLWADLSAAGFKPLQRAWLFAAAETWTPPVLSKGLLYVCQNSRDAIHRTPPRLLCYDLRGEAPPRQ